jgi:hypothetical protein
VSKNTRERQLDSNSLKKGLVTVNLSEEEKQKYLTYKPISKMVDFNELKARNNFAIKSYKDSVYRGEIVD